MSKEMLELADTLEAGHEDGTLFSPPINRKEWRMIIAALRASAVAEQVAWCQPMDCGKHTQRKFLLYFEDADRGIAVFDDEAEARAAFERADTAWNCYLFGALPKAVAHPAPAAPVPASVFDRLNAFFTETKPYGYAKDNSAIEQFLVKARAALASFPVLEAAPTREEIARIIDPDAKFEDIDGVQWSKFELQRRELAYLKANAILALKAAR